MSSYVTHCELSMTFGTTLDHAMMMSLPVICVILFRDSPLCLFHIDNVKASLSLTSQVKLTEQLESTKLTTVQLQSELVTTQPTGTLTSIRLYPIKSCGAFKVCVIIYSVYNKNSHELSYLDSISLGIGSSFNLSSVDAVFDALNLGLDQILRVS